MNISCYQLNHPKAYLGYCLALAEGGDRETADALTTEYITGGPGMARRGAENLRLVTPSDDGYALTERGVWVAEILPEKLGADDAQEAFATLDELRGSRERFIDRCPKLYEAGPAIAMGDPTIRRLVGHLQDLHEERLQAGRNYGVPTNELCHALYDRDAEFGCRLLIRDHDGIRAIVCGDEGPEEWEQREMMGQLESVEWGTMPHDADVTVYRTSTTYQLKTMGWHFGVFQTKGTQADQLDPREETWALEAGLNDLELEAPREYVPNPQQEVA